MPDFKELPFTERPDLTPYLVHLTRGTQEADGHSAFDNLLSILKTGQVWASDTKRGFIKGPNKAACFMDIPFSSLKYVLNPRGGSLVRPRYEPYGIAVGKPKAYERGCRPVLYLSNDEVSDLDMPEGELWRVVRLEVSEAGWISWLHEREWRCKGTFRVPPKSTVALVRTAKEATALTEAVRAKPNAFKAIPSTVLALDVVCQGLAVSPGRAR